MGPGTKRRDMGEGASRGGRRALFSFAQAASGADRLPEPDGWAPEGGPCARPHHLVRPRGAVRERDDGGAISAIDRPVRCVQAVSRRMGAPARQAAMASMVSG